MCLDCDGLGSQYTFAAELLIPDPTVSFFDDTLGGNADEVGSYRLRFVGTRLLPAAELSK
jgi:excinuclease UvrABC ATPase subunit